MRYKIAIAMIATGCLVIGALFVIRQKSNAPFPVAATQSAQSDLSSAQQSAHVPDTQVSPAANFAKAPITDEAPNLTDVSPKAVGTAASPQSGPNDAAKASHEAYVSTRVSELEDLAMDNDSSSLDVILSELTNADPEIRKAALEAAIQFGSRDAIPKLAEVASQTDDPEEKKALTDAIEFLKLPSLTEVLAANKGAQSAQTIKPVKAARPKMPTARLPGPLPQ